MDYSKESLKLHKKMKGKIEMVSKIPVRNIEQLSVAYTPGIAAPCKEIAKKPEDVYTYTSKANTIAVVSDGSAVLGLGNIGPKAAIPVMEGKAILFKEFANVDAVPICLDTQDSDEIVETILRIAPCFGGINLEDIAAPKCFEIEKALLKKLDIPVFHDDQHGTAIVVLAGLINALKLAAKKMGEVRIVMSGAGAAGIAIAELLLKFGAKHIILVDSKGAIYQGRKDMNPSKEAVAKKTNKAKKAGSLAEVIKGSDVFIGISGPGLLSKKDVSSMNDKAIVFAMANPIPEIMPEEAKKGGAFIVASGRSDYPNQINNVLAFPGVFRGLLDSRVKSVTIEMQIAAAEAIAKLVAKPKLDKIIPGPFEKGIATAVAKAIIKASNK